MKNRYLFPFLLTLSLLWGSCGKDKYIVLYDACAITPIDTMEQMFGGTWQMTDSALLVRSVVTPKQSGLKMRGQWDLSQCNKLLVTVTNFNQKEYLPLTVHLEGVDASLSKQKEIFLERIYVPAGVTATFAIDLPSVLPDDEVKQLCRGMRRDPFYQWGSISTLHTDSVRALAVYVNKPREIWDWALVSVKAAIGQPNRPYPWMTMTKETFFPFIDQYGQFKHNEWPGKIHSDEELKAAYEREQADLAAHPGPDGRNQYGSWLAGPKLQATGHFRVEKVDGKWWLVDPEGYLYWSHGVVRVTPSSAMTPLDGRESYFEALPAPNDEFAEFYTTRDELLYPYYEARGIRKIYDFSAANIKRKYGTDWRNQYAATAQQRLKSWGLNTIANSSDKSICFMRQTPYTDRIELKSPELESSVGVWWKFRDPFHPEFTKNFRKQLLERKDELDDPWCLGFFVDNEIDWGEPYTLGEWTMQCPATQPAKVEMVNWLKTKYKDIAALNRAWETQYPDWKAMLELKQKPGRKARKDCTEFSVIMTETYFRNVRDEFKKVAPGKLYMGCRFARSNENVIRIGANYCDVISYNIYKRNLNGFALPEGLDKPVMIGEFHVGALDRGMFHPGLIKMASQDERGECYADYVTSALRHPNIIGTHWHQFSDQATTGRFDGENFQVGFTDVCDTPYPETVAKIREVGYRMYEIRNQQ